MKAVNGIHPWRVIILHQGQPVGFNLCASERTAKYRAEDFKKFGFESRDEEIGGEPCA